MDLVGTQLWSPTRNRINSMKFSSTSPLNPHWIWIVSGLIGLCCTYILKTELNPYSWLHGVHETWHDTWATLREGPEAKTIINKTFRYLLNDLFSILIIHGLFRNRRYTRFAFQVLLFGLLFLLPVYFSLVYFASTGFSSMISHFHRIIMNPVLMMLLIPYFLFTRTHE